MAISRYLLQISISPLQRLLRRYSNDDIGGCLLGATHGRERR